MIRLLILILLTNLTFGGVKHFDSRVVIGDRVTGTVSAALQVESSTQGFLGPRMTQAERDAIASPAEGLMIYNTDTNSIDVFSGGIWGGVGGGGSDHPLWLNSTAYGIGTIVVDGNTFKVYRNNTVHTSTVAAFNDDLALGYWDELSDDLNRLTVSQDNAIVRFDGTGGDDIQTASVFIDDSSNVTGINDLYAGNMSFIGNTITATDTNGNLNLSGQGTGTVIVTSDLQVNGDSNLVNVNAVDLVSTGTLTANDLIASTLETETATIYLNRSGTQADAEGGGLVMRMSDATDASIVHDSSLASEWKLGRAGSEVEIADVSSLQSLSNKSIEDPTRLDVKKSTEADLTTYSATATDGQIVFATDTQKMYQVISNELKAIGGGGEASTGIYDGGLLSIGTPTNTFSISDGNGLVVDSHTDPNDIQITEVEWTGLSNLTLDFLATDSQTYIGLTSTASVTQQTTPFTPTQLRDIIRLGVVVHTNNTDINYVSGNADFLGSPFNQVVDLTEALGAITTGAIYYSEGGLTIGKSSSETFLLGENYENNKKNPNFITNSATATVTFFYNYQDGLGDHTIVPNQTAINPDLYDDGSGTLATVPNNKWTAQRIYFAAPSDQTVVQYGQAIYSTRAEAEAAILTEDFTKDPDLSRIPQRAWLIVKKGSTDLRDTAQAKFVAAGKLGETAANGSISSTTTLTKAYENSEDGALLLNGNGAFGVKDAATPLGTELFYVANNDESIIHFASTATATHVNNLKFLVGEDTASIRASAESNILITDSELTNEVLRKESDIRYFEDFKQNAPADIYTATGVTNSVTNETSNPLEGRQSGKFVVSSGDDGGRIIGPTISGLDRTDKGLLGISMDFIYDGGLTGDISLVVQESFDGSSFEDVVSMDLTGSATVTPKLNFQLSATATAYRQVFEVVTAASAGTIEWDNVKVIKNPLPVAENIEWQSSEMENTTAFSNADITGTLTASSGNVNSLYTYDSSTGVYTVTSNCLFNISATLSSSATAFILLEIQRDTGSGYSVISGDQPETPTGHGNASVEIYAQKGHKFKVRNNIANSTDVNKVFVTAKRTSNNVVFQGQTSDLDWKEYTPTLNGATYDSSVSEFLWRLQDGAVEIQARWQYNSAPSAVEFQLPLPNGYTVHNALEQRVSAHSHVVGYGRRNDSLSIVPLAVGGNSYVNMSFSTSGTSITPKNANDLGTNGSDFTISVRVPINEVKASDLLYSVPVTNERYNSISLYGNDGRAITANTESIPFDVSGNSTGWIEGADGSTTTNGNYYTVQESGSQVVLDGHAEFTSNARRVLQLYKNGVFYRNISYDVGNSSATSITKFQFSSKFGEFQKGDKLAITSGIAGTLLSSSIKHYLNITEEYAPKGYFLGNMPSTAHITGGTEYATAETWNGKRVYARAYELVSNITTTTTIDTIPTGLNPMEEFTHGVNASGEWNKYLWSVTSSDYAIFRYTSSTGVLNISHSGARTLHAGQKLIIRYTK